MGTLPRSMDLYGYLSIRNSCIHSRINHNLIHAMKQNEWNVIRPMGILLMWVALWTGVLIGVLIP